jgi:hypothetical protein
VRATECEPAGNFVLGTSLETQVQSGRIVCEQPKQLYPRTVRHGSTMVSCPAIRSLSRGARRARVEWLQVDGRRDP